MFSSQNIKRNPIKVTSKVWTFCPFMGFDEMIESNNYLPITAITTVNSGPKKVHPNAHKSKSYIRQNSKMDKKFEDPV